MWPRLGAYPYSGVPYLLTMTNTLTYLSAELKLVVESFVMQGAVLWTIKLYAAIINFV